MLAAYRGVFGGRMVSFVNMDDGVVQTAADFKARPFYTRAA
jgi:hypothetical protein